MPGRRAIVLALAALGAAFPASAAAQSFDGFDDQSLTPAPVASAHEEVFVSPEFDSGAYTLQTGEQSSPASDQTTCTSSDPSKHVFGGRTSWIRFVTRVAGTVDFRADTPGYDSVAWIRSGPVFGPGQSSFSDILNIDCSDGIQNAPGGERVVQHLTPDRMFHLQIAGVCNRAPNPPATACPDQNAAPGGPTRFRVIFTPDNADGDEVADTLDGCKTEPGPPENNGCPNPTPPPDGDGDQIPDADDDCPGVFGQARPRPRNGCPDGGPLNPEPVNNCPPGTLILPLDFPGVTVNNGDFATKSLDVLLSLGWPSGANEIAVSNDGGGPFTAFPLQRCIQWRLRDTPEGGRETRNVYIRFRGPGVASGAIDDILVDRVRPAMRDAEIDRRSVSVIASDANAGVASFDLLDRRGKRISQIVVCRDLKTQCSHRVARKVSVKPRRRPAAVRVIDAAGNASSVRPFQATGCAKGIRGVVAFKHTCLYVGKACKSRFAADYQRFGFRCRGGRLRD